MAQNGEKGESIFESGNSSDLEVIQIERTKGSHGLFAAS